MRIKKESRRDTAHNEFKSLFLGPQAENHILLKKYLDQLTQNLITWRRSAYPEDGEAISLHDQRSESFQIQKKRLTSEIDILMGRLRNEIPKFSPRYVAHMVSDVSLPALIGHIIALLHNPNNISGEASRVALEIEKEAIEGLSRLVGYNPNLSKGHFTSGGTIANIEALARAKTRLTHWLSRSALHRKQNRTDLSLALAAHSGWAVSDAYGSLDPDELTKLDPRISNPFSVAKQLEAIFETSYQGPVLLVPESRHYSWDKAVQLLGLGSDALKTVELDSDGRLCTRHLNTQIATAIATNRPILMVVSVAGTTERGTIDPCDRVCDVIQQWREKGIHLWHHIDAAYGGFLCTLLTKPPRSQTSEESLLSAASISSLRALRFADSISLDPHKLGYVPYSSGALLIRHHRDYPLHHLKVPYIQVSHGKRGDPETIEGSRSAGGALATWLIEKTVGLHSDGYGTILGNTIRARTQVEAELLAKVTNVRIAPGCDTNILCFCVANDGESVSTTNRRMEKLFDAFSPENNHLFFVSKTNLLNLSGNRFAKNWVASWNAAIDCESLVLVRLVLMNPFFVSDTSRVNFPQLLAESIEDALVED